MSIWAPPHTLFNQAISDLWESMPAAVQMDGSLGGPMGLGAPRQIPSG